MAAENNHSAEGMNDLQSSQTQSAPRHRRKPRMFPTILIVLGSVIALFVIIVALQPADFRITRTATIAAPAPVVFAQVNDFHNWRAWSPWEHLDPAMKRTYEG